MVSSSSLRVVSPNHQVNSYPFFDSFTKRIAKGACSETLLRWSPLDNSSNVFSPNGDPWNNVFRVDSIGDGPVSIRNFKITIFNRAGQVVHEYNGDIRDWEGWDGTVKNSSREATEGNYYYVVEILGWDKKTYDNDDYSKSNSGNDDSGDTGNSSNVIFGHVRLYR